MAFVQLSADQQQGQLCFKMDRLDVLRKQSYIRENASTYSIRGQPPRPQLVRLWR